jgi:hypothetical protein
MKTLLVYLPDVDRFVELIARSKAIWLKPELLNLVAVASSPSAAYDLVLEKTGKRKKALAARWLAVAVRDYDPMLVRSSIRFINGQEIRPEKLKEFLSTTLHCKEEEQYRERTQNEHRNQIGPHSS